MVRAGGLEPPRELLPANFKSAMCYQFHHARRRVVGRARLELARLKAPAFEAGVATITPPAEE